MVVVSLDEGSEEHEQDDAWEDDAEDVKKLDGYGEVQGFEYGD